MVIRRGHRRPGRAIPARRSRAAVEPLATASEVVARVKGPVTVRLTVLLAPEFVTSSESVALRPTHVGGKTSEDGETESNGGSTF